MGFFGKKVNTYNSVANRDELIKFVDHNNCRLGKWYNEGDGIKYFASAISYKELVEPHSIVHAKTKAILEDIKAENFSLHDIVIHLKEMESASFKIFEVLDKIFKERQAD